MPADTREVLQQKGYDVAVVERNASPIAAGRFDPVHGAMPGGSGNTGGEYGIAW